MLPNYFIAFSYSIFDVCFVLKKREISFNSAWRHLALESFFPQQQYITPFLSEVKDNFMSNMIMKDWWFDFFSSSFFTFDFDFISLMHESASIFFFVLKLYSWRWKKSTIKRIFEMRASIQQLALRPVALVFVKLWQQDDGIVRCFYIKVKEASTTRFIINALLWIRAQNNK